ncbi:hypothetical protein [Nocardioides panacisoli]|uniref:Secreted protein n=1 Tax=Nocardioides panacisoli TaxID=627624 RepID=A0ABP7HXU6_9ACTN
MTQGTAAAAPAPPPAAPAPAQQSVVQYPAPSGVPAGHAVEDTPTLLNRLQLAGMAIAIVFGLLSAMLQFFGWQADGNAAGDTEQLIRVQEIQSSLLHADALATNAFLEPGKINAEQSADYTDALDTVLTEIAAAAKAQPADQKALAALAVDVNDYATGVALARAYNEEQKPVGAEYLSEASASLHANALPILDNLTTANSDRAQGSMAGQHPIWLALVGILALVGLWWLNRRLAQLFRRRVNVGLAVAAVIVLLVTVVSGIAAWRGDNQNDSLRGDQLANAIDQSAARTAANDAKANESLRLINRGSGDKYEGPWADDAKVVEAKADPDSLSDWEAYTRVHKKMMDLEETDFHRQAVAIATDSTKDGATALFQKFDAASVSIIDKAGDDVQDQLRSGRSLAFAGLVLTVLLGIVAAMSVSRGLGARRREYA